MVMYAALLQFPASHSQPYMYTIQGEKHLCGLPSATEVLRSQRRLYWSGRLFHVLIKGTSAAQEGERAVLIFILNFSFLRWSRNLNLLLSDNKPHFTV